MTKTYKIVTLIIFTVVIIPIILIGSCAIRVKQYRDGFAFVEMHQSKESVIHSMGKAPEIRSCNFQINNRNEHIAADCFEIFTYKGIYEQWEVAFDKNEKVIEKYYWFLGEYGNRPPDLH